MEWELELKRQFSLVGQNFSWLEQVGHGLEQRLKQNQEDLLLLAHLQELYLFVKEYGLILNQELNPIKILLKYGWEKVSKLGMPIRTP